MLRALMCRLNLGHHWLADLDTDTDGGFRRHCVRCGKVDPHMARRAGPLAERDHPGGPFEPGPGEA